jgi:hypothetical protein
MNELVALEDLCTTLRKEVADLEKERREAAGSRRRQRRGFYLVCATRSVIASL